MTQTPLRSEAASIAAQPGKPAPRGTSRVLSRLRRQPVTLLAFGFVLLLGVLAVAAPWLAPYDPTKTDYSAVLSGPTPEHLLGTDDLGRDTLSRLIHGIRIALVVAFGSVAVAMLIGVPLGLLLGYRGGWTDRIGSRTIDIFEALPGVLVGFAVIAILGRGLGNMMLAIGLIFCMNFARMTRAVALAEGKKLYVEAAKVSGLRGPEILFRQILPNLAGPLVVQAAIFMGSAIMVESALSFLGIGLESSTATWGAMLGVAAEKQGLQPFLPFPPGIAIVATVLAFNLLGDGINDALAGGHRRPGRRWFGTRPTAGSALSTERAGSTDVVVSSDGASSTDSAASAQVPGQVRQLVPGAPIPSRSVVDPVLELRGVNVELVRPAGSPVPLVQDAWLSLGKAEVVGLLGESGSGKSMLARAALGLLPAGTRLSGGSVLLNGTELAGKSERQLRTVRGSELGVVFQDPMAALSPVHTVVQQLSEPLRAHLGMTKTQARVRAGELLDRVGVENPIGRLDDYPHQFSGGMAQRVAIAMALAAEPKVLIADEATSALDVTTQSQVLDLLLDLRDEFQMGILMITHDLGVVAESCDRAAVMYAGQIVEVGDVASLFRNPRHPYTAALLASNPTADSGVVRLPTIPGRVPLAGEWPTGCHFAGRCRFAREECLTGPVPLVDDVRCIRVNEIEVLQK